MARGGKREGAGRPKGSGKYGEPTKAVRVPISKLGEIESLIRRSHPNTSLTGSTPVQADRQKVVPISRGEERQEAANVYRLPLFMNPVAAGFPTQTEDYVEDRIDLNEHLIKHPSATFLVRVAGESMLDAGIHPHDILIVDRAEEARNGKIVIAVVDRELTVKRLKQHKGEIFLMPENESFEPLKITKEMDFHIWGVVTQVIHSL
ncbi:SOS response UmuD protein [Thalassoporum mexicanum PCC 7367]|uniref:LexA family protein n=1 Tax=Thalassoporum mexicanum TaxID=3457544 RepID=UPI00029FB384|nr:translesion error-prone DNA polymerase V autoproteolytic subunit [Pseudanabaena sp. PCC 7367]AFY69247.1 SOS response UmuD protein [Pseudanabaena sp. PCC 7367]